MSEPRESTPPNLDPHGPTVYRLPVRFNAYEQQLLQRAADLGFEAKQQLARRAIRDYCERKVRAAKKTG